MTYPHRVRIIRLELVADGGGGLTPSGEVTVYEGRADVQDMGAALSVRDGGGLEQRGDARLFLPGSLPDLGTAGGIVQGCRVEWDGDTRSPGGSGSPSLYSGVVTSVRRLDNSVEVSFH